MATNPFRAFIPYLVDMPAFALMGHHQVKDEHRSVDPSAGSWRTLGAIRCSDGNFIEDLDGVGRQMIVQFNERILPGKVRDEHLKAAVTRLQVQQGHPVSKKEYAQLRDQVEFDLLPKAFIRRTEVRVVFISCKDFANATGLMLVFTSSQKRADDVTSLMRGVFGERLRPWLFMSKEPMIDVLTSGLFDRLPADDRRFFDPGTSAVLKGADKQTIRVKDKDLGDHEIQSLEKQDFKVHELAMDCNKYLVDFVVNAGLIFKRVEIEGVKASTKDDFHGFTILYVKTIRDMLALFVEAIDGLAERPKPETPAIDLDDEEL